MVKLITRRDFIKGGTYTALGAIAGIPTQTNSKSRIILIRHKDVINERSEIDAEILQKMLDEAVMALFEESDPVSAFKKIIKPDDTVGIKTNVWSYLPTPKELENAIEKRVMDAGVDKSKIGINDHNVRRLDIFKSATALINVRPLRTHYLSGVSGCMKNLIMFAEAPYKWHPNSCADLGLLQNLPQVKGKLRLHILAVLTPQYHGRGPHHFSRRYVWHYKGLVVGTDAVAVDAVGLKLLMAKRREKLGKAREIPPVPKHIETADKVHGLGNSDFSRINLIKLGWKEDILI